MLSQHFADFLSRNHQPEHPAFAPLVRSLSESVEAGSSCLQITGRQGKNLEQWRDILRPGNPGSSVCHPGGHGPLVLTEQGNLYLQRYYLHELGIFQKVQRWINMPKDDVSKSALAKIDQLFEEKNDQYTAALTAIQRRFTIISGGPGTGKTTTVLKILVLLREQGYFTDPDDVLMVAPTGKAADRLRQSVISGLGFLEGIDPEHFPQQTSTIHRTLGFIPGSIEFRHTADNPLKAKVVIIDESSMVDLPMMHRLLAAIPDDARVMLLGDKNQLASVQVGTVLADLMEAAERSDGVLAECSVTLRKSYRNQGQINDLCGEIRDGKQQEAWNTLYTDPDLLDGRTVQQDLPHTLREKLTNFVCEHWLPVLTNTTLSSAEKLAAVDNFRVLSPTHNGPYGLEAINTAVEQILTSHGVNTHELWYEGRSVIVQRNDAALGVYNGDTGLVLDKQVHFAGTEGTRSFSPARLPEVKTAWALTIHRTQGSEYTHILLILPPATEETQLLSRELLYTAISRAKLSATVWCDEASFKQTIHSTVQRASGLTQMLNQI